MRLVVILLGVIAANLCFAQSEAFPAPPKIAFEEWKFRGETRESERYEQDFTSTIVSSYPANNRVKLRITVPRDLSQKVPVVILLHYWGAVDYTVEDDLADLLARRGIASVAMPLPYHITRTPQGKRSGELAILPDPVHLKGTILQSVSDVQRTVDWIETRPEFDSKRIAIGGTSLGSIIASTAFGVDKRFSAGAFLLAGADLAGILFSSSKVVQVRAELIRKGYSRDSLSQILGPYDAATVNDPSDKRPTLLVTGRFDTIVPPKSSDALAERLGNVRRMILDTGHFGGFLVQARLSQTLARFYESVLTGRAVTLPESINAPTIRLGALVDEHSGLQVALGYDIWRLDRDRNGFASVIFTPRGYGLFVGADLGSGIAAGASITPRRTSIGAFWSIVF